MIIIYLLLSICIFCFGFKDNYKEGITGIHCYRNNVYNGFSYYVDKGRIIGQTFYKNGREHGTHLHFNENGDTTSRTYYNIYSKSGVDSSFNFINGKIFFIDKNYSTYKTQELFYKNGQLRQFMKMDDENNIIDTLIEYYPTGVKKKEVFIIVPKIENQQKYYNKKGWLIYEIYFSNNTNKNKKYIYDKKGHLRKVIEK